MHAKCDLRWSHRQRGRGRPRAVWGRRRSRGIAPTLLPPYRRTQQHKHQGTHQPKPWVLPSRSSAFGFWGRVLEELHRPGHHFEPFALIRHVLVDVVQGVEGGFQPRVPAHRELIVTHGQRSQQVVAVGQIKTQAVGFVGEKSQLRLFVASPLETAQGAQMAQFLSVQRQGVRHSRFRRQCQFAFRIHGSAQMETSCMHCAAWS